MREILDVKCVKCHGVLEQKGGLELDTPEMVLKGGEDGAVVTAGKPWPAMGRVQVYAVEV